MYKKLKVIGSTKMVKCKFYKKLVSDLFLLFAVSFSALMIFGIIPEISVIGVLLIIVFTIIIWNAILRFIESSTKITGKISISTSKKILSLIKVCTMIIMLYPIFFA